MRAFFFWEPVGGLTLQHRCNPYAGLLARALARRDIHLELGDYAFTKVWLDAHRPTTDVLHLHWLHYFYREASLEATVARYAGFAENLSYAKSIGYRIVWTLHNHYPHERPFPHVDHLARLLICRLADHAIAHCRLAAGLARGFHRVGPVSVVPHGHFIDVFPNTVGRKEARAKLGLAEGDFVYLFFGNARSYKGLEALVAAFRAVARPDARLVLMMRRAFNPAYADEVTALARADDRIRVFTDPYFPESDFQYYVNSADVGVFPFGEVLTSGSVITALSFGLPVVVPALGCLPELVGNDCGVTYDPRRPDGLKGALEAARGADLASMRETAAARARSLDWESIADRHAAIYRGGASA